MLKAVFAATELQIIRPILRGDGVAITDDGAVLRRSTHGHIAEEVGQLRLAGCVHRNIQVLRFVAVGVQPDSAPQVNTTLRMSVKSRK